MKFGQSENPEMIEFQLPSDDLQAAEILKKTIPANHSPFIWVVPNGTKPI